MSESQQQKAGVSGNKNQITRPQLLLAYEQKDFPSSLSYG
jgi:hypothetical protein